MLLHLTLLAASLTSAADINALSRPDFRSGHVVALTGTVSSARGSAH